MSQRRIWSALLLAAALAVENAASAQGAAGELNLLSPGPSPLDDMALSRPLVGGDGVGAALLTLDYANDPLVYESRLGDPDSERYAVVGHQLDARLALGYGLWNRLLIYAGVPVTAWMSGDDVAAVGLPEADGTGLGAIFFGARLALLGVEPEDGFGLGLQVGGTAPGIGSPVYRADEGATLRPALLLEGRFGRARVTANAGALFRRDTANPGTNLSFGDELTFGLGAAIGLGEGDSGGAATELLLQVHGRTSLQEPGLREALAVETLGAARFDLGDQVWATVGGGLGLTRGVGAPDARLLVQMGSLAGGEEAPPSDLDADGIVDEHDRCPRRAEDLDGFEDEDGCPDPDNDGDGIEDERDQCRDEPETVNEYQDEDGCPDEVPDTDGDGLKDTVDRCVEQPEDKDGFEDEDGCPDPDNDEDGVLDSADACPLQKGPVENRGCPDTDRDGDGVVDRLDNCPDEPGSADNHGCKKRQRVVIRENRLEILDKVYFKTGSDRIRRRSYALLMNVASVLNAHPEIKKVRVEGHTDSRGRREYNLDLSQRRAEAVVRFLVERGGVDASRLEARGFGPDRPVVPDARTRADHARNRRVEFNIVEYEPVVQVIEEEEAPASGSAPATSDSSATGSQQATPPAGNAGQGGERGEAAQEQGQGGAR